MKVNRISRIPLQVAATAGLNSQVKRSLCVALACCLVCCCPVAAQPADFLDPEGDAVIRRTDDDGDGAINPQTQRLPDVIEMRIGGFAPAAPEVDSYIGVWDAGGDFFRLDMMFTGLINPPGPLNWDDQSPVYAPFLYGPHPVFGFVELDMDADENTGGELEACEYRYLGAAARFGGLPSEDRFAGRAAADASAFDGSFTTPPQVERSGEEFHLAFIGEMIEEIDVIHEKPGGDPAIFEEGERWQIGGYLFHRAHAFEYQDFAFTCVEKPGIYEPWVIMQFEHDPTQDLTTVSLVYPLTNEGSAALIGPSEPVEDNDGCDYNQNSVEEALDDLKFSAANPDPANEGLPEFILIVGWATKTVVDHLDPTTWRVAGVVGTAYGTVQPDGARFIWTDVYANPRVGDFNGDDELSPNDVVLLNSFIALADGDPLYDDDGNGANGSIDWHNYAENFCLFDTNYDGFVDASDAVVPGDMDLNQMLDIDDVDDFVLAVLDPDVYRDTHNGADPLARGDLNDDGNLNGLDIAGFADLFMTPW